jgi:hypothetical protein
MSVRSLLVGVQDVADGNLINPRGDRQGLRLCLSFTANTRNRFYGAMFYCRESGSGGNHGGTRHNMDWSCPV